MITNPRQSAEICEHPAVGNSKSPIKDMFITQIILSMINYL